MVFDRITLINAYNTLKLSQDNDGDVRNILFNKTSKYGTKTVPRFKNLKDLKDFINNKYPYWNTCGCATKNENIWTLLAFEVYSRPEDLDKDIIKENNKRRNIKVQPASKHATFVNNMRQGYESQKVRFQNSLSIKKTNATFSKDIDLLHLFNNYFCFPYIENQEQYVDPCEYVEIIKNDSYIALINNYYKLTRTREFPTQIFLF